MEIKLKYDPYALKAEVYNKDGESWDKNNGDWIKFLQGYTLRSWFSPRENWAGFCAVLFEAFNENDITIHFEGREVDFLDFQAACENYLAGKPDKRLTVCPPEAFLQDADVLKQLKTIRDEFAASPLKKTKQIKHALAVYNQWFKEDEFEIAVVAPMSSGKSTLINALLQQELLFTAGKSATNAIARIHDTDSSEVFTYESRDQAGKIIAKRQEATKEALEAANSDKDVFYLDLYGDIPGISGKDLSLKLIDTPGPNAEGREDLQERTRSIVNSEQQPVVLFVVSANNRGAISQAKLIDDIAEAMKDGQQIHERFIFVLNQADTLRNESIADISDEIREFAKNHGIPTPIVIPVSAIAALLQAQHDTGVSLSKKELHDLEGYQISLGEDPDYDVVGAADLSPTVLRHLEAVKAQAQGKNDESTLTMISSGIYGLKLTICEYLDKYAIPYKVRRYVEQVTAQLKDLETKTNFQEQINLDETALQEAQEIVARLDSKVKTLTERGDGLREKSLKISDETIKALTRAKLEELSSELNVTRRRLPEDEEIPLTTAKSLIKETNQSLSEKTAELKSSIMENLNKQLKEDFGSLLSECTQILQDYKDDLRGFPGLDPDKIFDLASIQDLIDGQAVFSSEDHFNAQSLSSPKEIKKRIRNPEKDSFWGKLKFWVPSQIEVSDTVQIVERGKIMLKINVIADQIISATDEIQHSIEALYSKQKGMFSELVDELNKAVYSTKNELNELIRQQSAKETDLVKLKKQQAELFKWLNNDLASYLS